MSRMPTSTDRPAPGEEAGAGEIARIREQFPILNQRVHGKPLAYLDSAASAQKPRAVIEAIVRFYESHNANVHRGAHALSDRATADYERARETTRRFLNARHPEEIIFVRGATEAINLVAQSYGRQHVGPGDEVVITEMEHHANLVPWQQLCKEKGAALRVAPITDAGELRLDALEGLLTPRTKILALAQVSNALGTVNPVKEVVAMARRRGIPVLVDGAQGAPHLGVDVRDLDCDFYAFSGHKVYGPMGIGALYGRRELLEAMPPWQCGGDMVRSVTFEETTFNDLPYRFEAGTPNVSGAVGLAAALEFLEGIGRARAAEHEAELLEAAVRHLREIPGVRIVGEPEHRAGVVSFLVEDPPLSALDVGALLDAEGIAVRAGHHCCQPLMRRLGIAGTVRASFAAYNTMEEVERFAAALRSIVRAGAAGRPAPAPDSDDDDLAYPGPSSPTIEAEAEALLDELDDLDGWGDRYEFLIEIGRKSPPLPARLKTEANRVRGCQSTVHMSVRAKPGTRDVVEFLADSDSELVRGLLALLQTLFSGRDAKDILAFDLPGFLARGGLESNLSTGRRNGLAEMIKRLRATAASFIEDGPGAPEDPEARAVPASTKEGRSDERER